MSAITRSSTAAGQNALLACGAIAGPLLIVVGFAQIPLRAGFDWTRHPLSMLTLGEAGWVQVANFIVSGSLFVLAAVGIRGALKGSPAGTWGPILMAGIGVGLVMGGIFTADPGFGFPPGAPAGPPAGMSWHAGLHLAGFLIGFVSLAAASIVFGRRYWKMGQRSWAVYSVASGVVVAASFPITISGLSGGNLLPLWVALVVGWLWASSVPARLLKVGANV